MKINDYFKDWMRVIDLDEARKIMGWLRSEDPSLLCPNLRDIFKAFELCEYNELKAVFIGQDPYPQKDVATGILFGNKSEPLSPSLQVIKHAVVSPYYEHYGVRFDNTLESWARQGILMINSALTCKEGVIGSHVKTWRPFIAKLLTNICKYNTGIIYVLFGLQAQSLEPYINQRFNKVIEVPHPSFYARTGTQMSPDIFKEVIDYVFQRTGYTLELFECYEQEDNKCHSL